jgi:hypothetical protein
VKPFRRSLSLSIRQALEASLNITKISKKRRTPKAIGEMMGITLLATLTEVV